VIECILQISHSLHESVKRLLTNTATASGLWDLEVSQGVLQIEELLLEGGNACLQILVLLILETFKLGPETLDLVLKLFNRSVNLLDQRLLDCISFLVCVSNQL
jgi:hypothetical protein